MFRVILLARSRALAIYPDVPIALETPPHVVFYTMTCAERAFRQISTPLGEAIFRKGVGDPLVSPPAPYATIDSMGVEIGDLLRWWRPCDAFAVRR